MDQMVITFGADGKVGAMHNDAFNLSFLGKRTIKRASDIVFNPESDKWDIFMNDGTGAFVLTSDSLKGFDDYEQARKFEVNWLNACRMQGIDGSSERAMETIAPSVRHGHAILTA